MTRPSPNETRPDAGSARANKYAKARELADAKGEPRGWWWK